MKIGYVLPVQQFGPAAVIQLAGLAERNGFDGAMAADHFQPWLPRHAEAPFVWNVLAAVAERTSGDLGPVTTPTFRWHPAVVAQASATLAAMYPGRHWLGIGSGEALNEHIVGRYWPEPPERINRMFEAIDMIKKLFAASLAGRDVRHSGTHFTLESTRLWTMPDEAPEILVATAGPITARRAGRSVDGLITQDASLERLELLLKRFDEGAREAGRNESNTTKALQLHLSWAPTDEQAWQNALAEWPIGALRAARGDIRSPFEFEQLVKSVRPEDFARKLQVSADPDVHRAHIQRFVDLGFDRIYLHNVGRNQEEWIDVFGRDVLPRVSR